MLPLKPFMALACSVLATTNLHAEPPGYQPIHPTAATTGHTASPLYGARPTDRERSFIREMQQSLSPQGKGTPPTVIGSPPMEAGSPESATQQQHLRHSFIVDIYAADVGGVPSDLSLIQQLQICHNDTCHPIALSASRQALKDNTQGEASLIGTATLPAIPDIEETSIIEINRITLRSEHRGQQGGTEMQSLTLHRPVRLFSILPGARIFIGLNAQTSCQGSPCLKLDSADTTLTPLHNDGQYLHYNPATGMDRTLPHGIRLQLPRHMTDGVQIIVTNIQTSPAHDYPDMSFAIHDTMKAKAIVHMSRIHGLPSNGPAASTGQATTAMPDAKEERILEISGAGRIVNGTFSPIQGPDHPSHQ